MHSCTLIVCGSYIYYFYIIWYLLLWNTFLMHVCVIIFDFYFIILLNILRFDFSLPCSHLLLLYVYHILITFVSPDTLSFILFSPAILMLSFSISHWVFYIIYLIFINLLYLVLPCSGYILYIFIIFGIHPFLNWCHCNFAFSLSSWHRVIEFSPFRF